MLVSSSPFFFSSFPSSLTRWKVSVAPSAVCPNRTAEFYHFQYLFERSTTDNLQTRVILKAKLAPLHSPMSPSNPVILSFLFYLSSNFSFYFMSLVDITQRNNFLWSKRNAFFFSTHGFSKFFLFQTILPLSVGMALIFFNYNYSWLVCLFSMVFYFLNSRNC